MGVVGWRDRVCSCRWGVGMDHAEWMDRYNTGRRTIDLRHAAADANSTVDSGRDMTFTAYCLLVMIVLVALAVAAGEHRA